VEGCGSWEFNKTVNPLTPRDLVPGATGIRIAEKKSGGGSFYDGASMGHAWGIDGVSMGYQHLFQININLIFHLFSQS
jgi:hypothetical protein